MQMEKFIFIQKWNDLDSESKLHPNGTFFSFSQNLILMVSFTQPLNKRTSTLPFF